MGDLNPDGDRRHARAVPEFFHEQRRYASLLRRPIHPPQPRPPTLAPPRVQHALVHFGPADRSSQISSRTTPLLSRTSSTRWSIMQIIVGTSVRWVGWRWCSLPVPAANVPISNPTVEAVIVVIGGIASIFTGKSSFPTFHPVNIKYINSTSLQEACVTLPRACANIDTPEALFRIAATPYIS